MLNYSEFLVRLGWAIHISNDNESFTFYVDIFFPVSRSRLLSGFTVYMSNTADKTSAVHHYVQVNTNNANKPSNWG
jgi:hypothetical protein